jgi:hypothetical protein
MHFVEYVNPPCDKSIKIPVRKALAAVLRPFAQQLLDFRGVDLGIEIVLNPFAARTEGNRVCPISASSALWDWCYRCRELAPPGTETPLFRGEFAAEMSGQKGMDVKILVKQAIAGIEAGNLEICPGLSNILKVMSRIAT